MKSAIDKAEMLLFNQQLEKTRLDEVDEICADNKMQSQFHC